MNESYFRLPSYFSDSRDAGVAADDVVAMAMQNSHSEPDGRATILQTIVDSLADGLAAVDRDGRFIQFNPSGAAILGRGPVDAPSETWPETYGLYRPDGRTPFPHQELPLVRALSGEHVGNVEMIHRPPDGSPQRWLRVTAAPLLDDDGRPDGAVVLFRDETENKQTQLALDAERRFLRHLIQIQDRDRQLTAYDLHDGIVQLMTAALLHLGAAEPIGARPNEAKRAEQLETATDLLRQAIDEARRLIGGLRPPALDELGVVGALTTFLDDHFAQSDVAAEFRHDVGSERPAPLVESTIFRIAQEALTNVVRHAQAKHVRIDLRREEEHFELSIRDDGLGFAPADRDRRRFGLRGMEERTRLLGGDFRVVTEPGRGTQIIVRLPIEPAPETE